MNFMAPIPGMSLTKEPGNAPYEQPPLYTKPEEALAFYLSKFDNPDTMDDVMFSLSHGISLDVFVDSMTSVGVMEGYHSFDVKVLISPILHEYLLNLAKAAGVDVVEHDGPSPKEKATEKQKKRMGVIIEKALSDNNTPSDTDVEKAEELLETPAQDSAEPQEPDSGFIKRR
jgi:hypothetical protein